MDETAPSFATITTLALNSNPEEGESLFRRSRTVGVFPSLEGAQEALDKNWGDLNEAGYYPYAVIEVFHFGLYPQVTQEPNRHWYQYEEDAVKGWPNGVWHKVEVPPLPASRLKRLSHLATIG